VVTWKVAATPKNLICSEYTVTTERGVDMTDETKTYEYDELRRLVRIVQDENETTPYSEEWTRHWAVFCGRIRLDLMAE